MCEFEQVISDAGHRRDDRHDPAALALCLEESLRDVTDSFRCSNGSATIFLNYQTHVQMKINSNENTKRDSFRSRLQLNCASHIRYRRGDRFQFFHSLDDHIGVFQAVSGDCANDPTGFWNFLE